MSFPTYHWISSTSRIFRQHYERFSLDLSASSLFSVHVWPYTVSINDKSGAVRTLVLLWFIVALCLHIYFGIRIYQHTGLAIVSDRSDSSTNTKCWHWQILFNPQTYTFIKWVLGVCSFRTYLMNMNYQLGWHTFALINLYKTHALVEYNV